MTDDDTHGRRSSARAKVVPSSKAERSGPADSTRDREPRVSQGRRIDSTVLDREVRYPPILDLEFGPHVPPGFPGNPLCSDTCSGDNSVQRC